MSLWNHYSHFTEDHFERVNSRVDRVGEAFPRCPGNIRDFWKQWIGTGWFAWESEGYPFWSMMRHIQTWWDFRHLPNILFVHFENLLSNLEGEIRRVADFMDTSVPDELLHRIGDEVTFKIVKKNAEGLLPGMDGRIQGGAKTFINEGTNGRWRSVLTEEDLELYAGAVVRELAPDCAHWLENGRL